MMESILRDLRLAVRSLARTRGLAAVIVLTLGLGIGTVTTFFGLVDALLLRPLPFPEADRLVTVTERFEAGPLSADEVRQTSYEAIADHSGVFEAVGAYRRVSRNLASEAGALRLTAAEVSPGFFSTLAVPAARGRVFSDQDSRAGNGPIAVISHGLWQRYFAGSGGAVGGELRIEDQVVVIAGIMPEGFGFPRNTDLWLPLPLHRDPSSPGLSTVAVAARLSDGVMLEQAQAELDRLSSQLPTPVAADGPTQLLVSEGLVDRSRGFGSIPYLLLGAGCFVLLIVCLNVGSLLLARTVARRSDFAIRSAIGGTKKDLLLQNLAESSVLALAGGGVGLLLSLWWTDLLTGMWGAGAPSWFQPATDLRVLVFTLVISALCVLAFGTAPALEGMRASVLDSLQRGKSGTTSDPRGRRAQRLLVMAEVGLAFVLLLGAALMTRSYLELRAIESGLLSDQVLSFRLTLTRDLRDNAQASARYVEDVVNRVSAMPGVQSVGQEGAFRGWIQTEAVEDEDAESDLLPDVVRGGGSARADGIRVVHRVVSDNYFETVGLRISAGQGFQGSDRLGSPPVALVSETLADRLWPGRSPLGQQFRLSADAASSITVIGLVEDVISIKSGRAGSRVVAEPFVYFLDRQASAANTAVLVRALSDPESLIPQVREAVTALDSRQVVEGFRTLAETERQNLLVQEILAVLFFALGGVGSLLAAMGIFGTISYSIQQRTREIGIRTALGAARSHLLRLVVAEGLWLAGLGVAGGLILSLAASRVLRFALAEVSAFDVVSILAVAVTFSLVTAGACLLPARRALRLNPTEALRND